MALEVNAPAKRVELLISLGIAVARAAIAPVGALRPSSAHSSVVWPKSSS